MIPRLRERLQWVAGALLTVVATVILVAMLTGVAHIDRGKRAAAWLRWRRSPSVENEAQWVREKGRVALEEAVVTVAASLVVGAGIWLVLPLVRRRGMTTDSADREQRVSADSRRGV